MVLNIFTSIWISGVFVVVDHDDDNIHIFRIKMGNTRRKKRKRSKLQHISMCHLLIVQTNVISRTREEIFSNKRIT